MGVCTYFTCVPSGMGRHTSYTCVHISQVCTLGHMCTYFRCMHLSACAHTLCECTSWRVHMLTWYTPTHVLHLDMAAHACILHACAHFTCTQARVHTHVIGVCARSCTGLDTCTRIVCACTHHPCVSSDTRSDACARWTCCTDRCAPVHVTPSRGHTHLCAQAYTHPPTHAHSVPASAAALSLSTMHPHPHTRVQTPPLHLDQHLGLFLPFPAGFVSLNY